MASECLAQTRQYLAEKKDGAQIDLDVVTHLISLFQASKQGKEERLVIIEVEVEDAQVQLLRSLAFSLAGGSAQLLASAAHRNCRLLVGS